jgi:hypothetical protein
VTFSDSRIAKILKEDFIPVWEAVAPVRTVTFNLGEGRSLKGSVSGEIAIYFCNIKGKVFDILPALQSPAVTLTAMKEAKKFHTELVNIDTTVSEKGKEKYIRTIENFHQVRMKEMAARKYDILLKRGTEIMKNPEKIPAATIFPNSAKGESKREHYINAAVDKATRDMRIMAMSKSGIVGPRNQDAYTDGAITVVEPGGRGYYLWQIGQVFHDIYPEGYHPRVGPNLIGFRLKTPDEWKKILFEGIFKQELKGGEVEYNSDSLEAINVSEE